MSLSSLYSDDAATDTDTEQASDRSSLDAELGWRLSQLSRAKMAVALNQVRHVRMCTAYDREQHVTVYVLDVFLHSAPRGLPRPVKDRKRRLLRDQLELRPDYQVEHRYSAFRELRERIGAAVAAPKDRSHPQWCAYCSRVRDLVSSGAFPARFPNGRVALATGLHDLLVRRRQERLETFVNLLLSAAKDISYRSGCTPCVRFEVVSKMLSDFLTEPHLRATGSAC